MRLAEESTVTTLADADGVLVVQDGQIEKISKADFVSSLNIPEGTGNTVQTLTDAATVVWEYAAGNIASVTLSASRSLAINGVAEGDTGVLIVQHDTAGTVFTNIVLPTGKTFTAEAGKSDMLGFVYLGGLFYWDIANYATTPTNGGGTGDLAAPTRSDLFFDNSYTNELMLVYNETLDTASIPPVSSFSSSGRTITGVRVADNKVFIKVNTPWKSTDSVTLSYTPDTSKIQDISGNAAPGFTALTVANRTTQLLSGASPVSFAATTFVNTNGILTNTATGNAYGHLGLSPLKLPANTDGSLIFKRHSSNPGNAILGFNTANAATGFGGMEYGFYLDPATGNIYRVNNGSPSTAGSLAIGDYARINRAGSVLKLQKSSDGVSWTDLYSYTLASSAELYVVCDLYGNVNAKMEYPQAIGLTL